MESNKFLLIRSQLAVYFAFYTIYKEAIEKNHSYPQIIPKRPKKTQIPPAIKHPYTKASTKPTNPPQQVLSSHQQLTSK